MKIIVWAMILSALPAAADYGWIPRYQQLHLRVGGEYFKTSENFLSDGTTQSIRLLGRSSELSEFRFFVEPEYGFAKDLSLWAKVPILQNAINSTDSTNQNIAKSTGLGDLLAAIKWNVKEEFPLLTLEANLRIPLYSISAVDDTDLVRGDGSLDMGFMLHAGYQIKALFFSVSPGFTFRFGGYASAIRLRTALGAKTDRFHGYLFSESHFSLSDSLLYDSSLDNHEVIGGGGSFARLSGSPTGMDLGARLGVRLINNYYFETYAAHSLAGRRYPKFWRMGVNFFAIFDFSVPDNRKRMREVPLDWQPEKTEEPHAPR
ncbi:MAG: hypothetical protein HY537_14995 [Deltaproteobacteria bacterium]|nr:hypothetical protein [Deltaproteobacteria bacterium]